MVRRSTIEITDYKQSAVGDIEIPAEIEGLPVTSIGTRAFEDCAGLTSISIPESITDISYNAFEDCSGLMSIANVDFSPAGIAV